MWEALLPWNDRVMHMPNSLWRAVLSALSIWRAAPAPGASVAVVAPERAFPAAEATDAASRPGWLARVRVALPHRLTPEWGIALLATALSITAYAWYAHQGLTLAYADSISHMMIARRVFFSRTPGLAQLGTVWLPLTHMLMLPFIWWDALFHSGLAGALLSMAAYILGAVYLYRLAHLAFESVPAGVIAAMVFMLNPSTIYMQGTPMTELPLMGLAIIALFYAVRWTREFDALDLVKSAAATGAGTLVRYDAWALAIALAILVAMVAWRRRGWNSAEANSLLYGSLAFAGCVSWLIYQQVILGNAFAFFNGPYSAASQQRIFLSRGQLQTLNNPVLSLHVYTQTVLDTVSLPIALVAVLGFVLWAIQARRQMNTLPMYAILIPFLFNWYSLVRGNSILRTPEISFGGVHTYYNVRYGMMMVPAIALFFAFAATRLRPILVAVRIRPDAIGSLALVVGFAFSSTVLAMPYALRDPVTVSAHEVVIERQQAAWLAAHCAGGRTLISESVFEVTIFYSRIPLSNLITDSSDRQFRQAMEHPDRSATCLVMDGHADNFEPVWEGLHNRQDWQQHFVLAAQFGTATFYQRVDAAPQAAKPAPGALSPSSMMLDRSGLTIQLASRAGRYA